MTAHTYRVNLWRSKTLIAAILLAGLILAGSFAIRGLKRPAPLGSFLPATTLSEPQLEEQFGLRVNLVAVTAIEGLVDVRLKMVDGEKARSLLEDPQNFPSLWIADRDLRLAVPEEVSTQQIKFEDDGNLFVLYANTQGVVHPGTPVTILFGDYKIEPIAAR